MVSNDTNHFLPLNSMLFDSHINPWSSYAADRDTTLADLREAQATTVTALPQWPTTERPVIDE